MKFEKIIRCGALLSVCGLGAAQGEDDIQGLFSFSAGSSAGTFDFFIDVSADTLTITNPTGRFESLFSNPEPLDPLTFFAHDNFTQTSATTAGLSGPTYDFTGEEESPLGLTNGDGFFWASDVLSEDLTFNFATLGAAPIGFENGGDNNLTDSGTSYFIRSTGIAPAGVPLNHLGIAASSVTVSSEAVPEPSSALLLGLSALGMIVRRRR